MPKMTLIVIDMLNDFFERHANLAEQRPQLVDSINTLVKAFRDHGQTVLWVRQEFAPDLHDAFLDMRKNDLRVTIAGTPGCELLPELHKDSNDQVIVKKRYSAFFGTDLHTILQTDRAQMLVVTGINTHACVRTTVIDAYQRDYEVVVAEECIASSNQVHHEITKQYLDGGIAQLLPNHKIIEMLSAHQQH